MDIANAEKRAAQEFEQAAQARKAQVDVEIARMNAQARLNISERFDGALPSNILPENSPLLLGLDSQ